MELFSVFGRIGLKTDEFERGISQSEEKGRGFGASFASVGATVAKGAAVIGTAMAAIGAAALRVGGQYDSSMRSIQARTGMAADDIDVLGLAFRDMALQGNFTAQQIANAYASIAVSGQDAEYGINIMNAAMIMAQAIGTDLGQTAYFLGNYLLKVGKDASDSEKYVNLFTQGVANTGISLANMQNYMFRMTPAFQQFGASSETNVAIMTRLYQAGIRGANLYSGMGTIMMEFGTRSGDAYEAVSRFAQGVLGANYATATNEERMFAAAVAMRDYGNQTEVAQIITDAMNQTQQAAWFEFMNLAETIQNDVIPGMYAATAATGEYGVAQRMAEEQNQSFAVSLAAIQTSGADALKTIFDIIEAPIAEVLGKAADTVRDLVLRLREGGDLHPVIQQLGNAIASVAGFIVNLGTTVIPIVLRALAPLGAALGTVLNLAQTLAPAILGVAAAFQAWKVGLAVHDKIDKIKTATKAFAESLGTKKTVMGLATAASAANTAAETARAKAVAASKTADIWATKATKARNDANLAFTVGINAGMTAEQASAFAKSKTATADKYATIASNLRKKATGLQTAATKAQTTADAAQAVATVRTTIVTRAATAAKKIFNATWKANPIGAVVAGVALLVGGLVALVGWLNRGSEATQELRKENERIISASEALVTSVQRSADAHQDNIRAMENEHNIARSLTESLFDLKDANDGSAESRNKLLMYTDKLVGIMPELARHIDNETGLLNLTREAIREVIRAREDDLRHQIAKERQLELLREEAELQDQLRESEAAWQAAWQHQNESRNGVMRFLGVYYRSHTRETRNARLNTEELRRQLDANARAQQRNNEIVLNGYERTTGAIGGFADAAISGYRRFAAEAVTAMGHVLLTTEEMAYLNEMIMDGLAGAVERATGQATNAFRKMSYESELSLESMRETLRHNAEATRNWGENIAAIMEMGMQRGVDEGVLHHMVRMAEECHITAQLMADDLQTTFMGLAYDIGDSMQAGIDFAVSVFNVDTETARAMQGWEESNALALRRQIELSDYAQIGLETMLSYAAGLESASAIAAIEDATRRATSITVDTMRDVLQIRSPSRLFRYFGEMTMDGYAEGISAKVDTVCGALKTMGQRIAETVGEGAATLAESVYSIYSTMPDFSNVSAFSPAHGYSAVAPAAPVNTTNNYHLHMHTVPQTTYETMAAARSVFEGARWVGGVI